MALHGFSFCDNGSINSIRKLNSLPCSCINNIAMHHRLPPALPNKVILSKISRRGHEVDFPLRLSTSSLQSGRFTPLKQASAQLLLRQCQVKSEESDSCISGESIALDEQTLEQELQIAIAEENYTKAAKIRDMLKALQEDSKTSVLMANARFYESFRTGDLAAMQVLWAKGDNVCCVHPGARGISGYDDVMTSWEYVWANYEFPLEIQLKDMKVHARGDIGYVTCLELVKTKGSNWGGQFATNVFEKINGQWFISIHHASQVDL